MKIPPKDPKMKSLTKREILSKESLRRAILPRRMRTAKISRKAMFPKKTVRWKINLRKIPMLLLRKKGLILMCWLPF